MHRGGSPVSSVVIYADGSSVPGVGSGAGIIVLDAAGRLIHLENQPLPAMTNNEAEYAGLALALKTAERLGADVVEVRLDSEIVVGQMIGEFAVNSPSLKQGHWLACGLARRFPRVRYKRIPRTQNVLADALAAEASTGRRWCLEGAQCSGL